MQQATPISAMRVVWTDLFSSLMFLWPLVFWLALLVEAWREAQAEASVEAWPFFLALAVVATLVCLPGLIWRVWSISQVFVRGVEVTGQVTRIRFYRGRGQVEYAYTYLGELYHAGNHILQTGRARTLAGGDAVVIVVDPTRPSRAYIRDLYSR